MRGFLFLVLGMLLAFQVAAIGFSEQSKPMPTDVDVGYEFAPNFFVNYNYGLPNVAPKPSSAIDAAGVIVSFEMPTYGLVRCSTSQASANYISRIISNFSTTFILDFFAYLSTYGLANSKSWASE